MDDLISRHIIKEQMFKYGFTAPDMTVTEFVEDCLPSAQTEPLTDKEQRIFLAAMGREEKVCEQVDVEWRKECGELYKDSLVRTCHEIIRKVKGALWTT